MNKKNIDNKTRFYLEQYIEGNNDLLGSDVYLLFKELLEAFYRNLRALYAKHFPYKELSSDYYYEGVDRNGKQQKASYWLPLELMEAKCYTEAVSLISRNADSEEDFIIKSLSQVVNLYSNGAIESVDYLGQDDESKNLIENNSVEIFFLTLLLPVTSSFAQTRIIAKIDDSLVILSESCVATEIKKGQIRSLILGEIESLYEELTGADWASFNNLFSPHRPQAWLTTASFSFSYSRMNELVTGATCNFPLYHVSGVDLNNADSLIDFINGLEAELTYAYSIVVKNNNIDLNKATLFPSAVRFDFYTRYLTVRAHDFEGKPYSVSFAYDVIGSLQAKCMYKVKSSDFGDANIIKSQIPLWGVRL